MGDIDDSAAAGWADYDRDGFIDLFAANSFPVVVVRDVGMR